MSILTNAFKITTSLISRSVTIYRGTSNVADPVVKIAPSNYFRGPSGPSDTILKGREFVIAKSEYDKVVLTGGIRRGDYIKDSKLGTMSIKEVREMFDLGGEILGYRIRVEE